MHLEISSLSYAFGNHRVLCDINLRAASGRITGLLGPNGAGKSTLMRCISGYLPFAGCIQLIDENKHKTKGLALRQRVGYLPENNPLYEDMYVLAFLNYFGRLHGISKKNIRQKIAYVMDACGLDIMAYRLISTLSKGYRQRVGLARALLHTPDVLILDEPSAGLDPNQLRKIHQLIKTIGEKCVVVFSTHIFQEVEALCDDVLLINKGQLLYNGELTQLQKGDKKLTDIFQSLTQDNQDNGE